MIFVTVGTHEQSFNRLLSEVDKLVFEKKIQEEVFMQTGYSTYIPKYVRFEQFVKYEDMKKLMSESDVIITHGGPASFMQVLSNGKIPIVVPRQLKYGEHINDHQIDFVTSVLNKGYDLDVVIDIENLNNIIVQNKINRHNVNISSHNREFIKGFNLLIGNIL